MMMVMMMMTMMIVRRTILLLAYTFHICILQQFILERVFALLRVQFVIVLFSVLVSPLFCSVYLFPHCFVQCTCSPIVLFSGHFCIAQYAVLLM